MEAPTTAVQDRKYLNMSIEEYRTFAEGVSSFCYINKQGQLCKLRKAKLKKLKNLRYEIKKSEILQNSLIWKEQLRLLEVEIQRRQKTYQQFSHA